MARLIDADALKKSVCIKFYTTPYYKHILDEIDNAPTVDAIPNEEGYEMYNKGYMSGYERGKEDRPHGEWIFTNKEDKEKGYGGYCSNCKCDMPIFNEDWKMKYCETDFCPNCGAKMKKEEENDN